MIAGWGVGYAFSFLSWPHPRAGRTTTTGALFKPARHATRRPRGGSQERMTLF